MSLTKPLGLDDVWVDSTQIQEEEGTLVIKPTKHAHRRCVIRCDELDWTFGQLINPPDASPDEERIVPKIQPYEAEDHYAYLEMAFVIHTAPTDGAAASLGEQLWFRFNFANLVGDIDVQPVARGEDGTVADDEINSLSKRFKGVDEAMLRYWLNEKGGNIEHWILELTTSGTPVYSRRLFAEQSYSSKLDEQIRTIRQVLQPAEHHRLQILVSQEGFGNTIATLNRHISAQRDQTPFVAFFPNNRSFTVQLGQVCPPESRPTVMISPAPYVYASWTEYLTFNGIGMIQEQEREQSFASAFVPTSMRLVKPAADNPDVFFAFMERSQFTEEYGLEPAQVDDSFRVAFPQNPHMSFRARVTEPMTRAPLHMVTLLLVREDVAENTVNLDQSAISGGDLTADNALVTIETTQPVECEIKPDISTKTWKQSLVALRTMHKRRNADQINVLLGNQPQSAPNVNIYDSLGSSKVQGKLLHSIIKGQHLNYEQRQALRDLDKTPAGIGLIIGPPGTGKSYLILSLCKLFHENPPAAEFKSGWATTTPDWNDDTQEWTDEVTGARKLPSRPTKHKTLVVAPHNAAVDNLASLISRELPTAKVVRLHAKDSERTIVKRADRPTAPDDQDVTPLSSLKQTLQGSAEELLGIARELLRVVNHSTSFPTPGIPDKRVKLSTLSLGHRMLRESGALSDASTPKPELWATFRTQLEDILNGNSKEWSDSEKGAWTSSFTALYEHTLGEADVLVATATNAGSAAVADAFTATLVLVDEAGMLAEAQFLPLLTTHAYSRAIVCFGDPRQLGPFQPARPSNGFSSCVYQSLFSRLLQAGTRRSELWTQKRFNVSIAGAVNKPFYRGELITDLSNDNRDLTLEVQKFNELHFNRRCNVVLIDTHKSTAHCPGGGMSVANEENAHHDIALVRMLKEGLPSLKAGEITILVPYNAQYALVRRLLASRSQEPGDGIFDEISVLKFDQMQGRESDITIVDMTIVDKLGFLSDHRRINTALSRARHGLYIIGNASRWRAAKGFYYNKLRDVVNYCYSSAVVRKWSLAEADASPQPSQDTTQPTPFTLPPLTATDGQQPAKTNAEASNDWS